MSTELTPAMRRSALIAMLRDRALWPEGFKWNYASPCCCADGLARKGLRVPLNGNYDDPWPEFGLSGKQTRFIFNTEFPGFKYTEVTPEMVANRLETVHRELANV